ncbi:putative ribonuclease H-like domain-containing protein [Tanacetum coccineum]
MLVQVYVDDIIFGSTKKSMCAKFEDYMHKRFQMSSMGELAFFLGLQVKQQPDGIFISQDKYVADILKKFDFWSIKTASTPVESNKPLIKDEDGEDVDVHVYRSMIGSLMYLTASRPDIMFAVYCICTYNHSTQFGLWLLGNSHFELEAFLDSDYGGASLDRKSTIGGCKFLGRRLISWQCKKQTIMANSTTEAEYVAAANYCGQVLWIHNQMMDYGFNFMNTKIYINNESTISAIKNPVAHSRTNHIEIRFHFIRDCYEKRLIEVIKIHTDSNVADLLTKGFNVTRFNFLGSKGNGFGKDFPNPFMAGSFPKTIKQSNDPPFSRGYTLGSGEDSLELKELMLEFCDKHNMVAYLVKYESSEVFDEIIDFLTLSHICYALTENLIIFVSLIEQFWETAALSTNEEGLQAISTTIDVYEKLITEDSLRRHLKLDDAEGISSLSNEEIFEHLAHMGYVTNSESLTFFTGVVTPLFKNMLVQAYDEEQLESPSRITSSPLLSQQPTQSSPSTEPIQTTHETKETASMPHDSPLHAVHSHGSAEGSVQQHNLTDLSKETGVRHGSLAKAKKKGIGIVLSNDEEIAEDSFNQGRKISQIDEDPTISLKGEIEISTASIQVSTTSPPKGSTDVPHVYTRKSAKDKGKAIMEEPATPKKVKKRSQVQLNKPVSIAQARRNMITYLKNQGGSEVDKDTSKPSERETSKTVEEGKVEEKDVNLEPVLIEKKAVRIRRKTLARRRASDKQGQDSSKRQKKKKESADYEEEKDKLRIWLTIVPDEEAIVDPEVLHTKYPIVDNESQSLGNMHVYKIIRVDGNTSYHKTFESMLKSFDRQDLEVLHRLVMERFQDNTPEGYNLMLWGDLKILVDPEQDDDI